MTTETIDTACEPGCYGEDPCRLCRLRSQRDDALARLEQARTEVAERTRERDEARRLHSVLHDVASGGCLHTMLRHEHACAVDSVNGWRTKADAAEKRATYAEQREAKTAAKWRDEMKLAHDLANRFSHASGALCVIARDLGIEHKETGTVGWANPIWEGVRARKEALSRPQAAATSNPTGDAQALRWGVLWQRETDPPVLMGYEAEVDARLRYDRLAEQWSHVWLVQVVDGPGPKWRTPENEKATHEAHMESCRRSLAAAASPGLGGVTLNPAGACACMVCTDVTRTTVNFRYACEVCGNKRCPHHADHRYRCTGSNEPGQVGEIVATVAEVRHG